MQQQPDATCTGHSVARLRTVDRDAAEDLFHACHPRLAGWVRRLAGWVRWPVDDDDTRA